MKTFKVGDRVKCINPGHGLVLNATYTIKHVDGKYVSVVSGKEATFGVTAYSSRFVKPSFKGNIK